MEAHTVTAPNPAIAVSQTYTVSSAYTLHNRDKQPMAMLAISALIGTPRFDSLLKNGLTMPWRDIDQRTRDVAYNPRVGHRQHRRNDDKIHDIGCIRNANVVKHLNKRAFHNAGFLPRKQASQHKNGQNEEN